MSQVSKYPISKDVAERIFDIFIKTLIKIKDNASAQKLTDDLFTPTEKIMIAKRLSISFLLLKGYQYNDIKQLLRVSSPTIAAVGRSLRYGSGGYGIILESINKEEHLEKFFLEMGEKILSIPARIPKGGSSWRYLREEVKKIRQDKQKQF